MYKKCYQGKKLDWNLYEMHLWESDDEHQIIPYENIAYVEDKDSYTCKGLNGQLLKPTINWRYSQNEKYKANNTPNLHFHDMKPYQKFLIDLAVVDCQIIFHNDREHRKIRGLLFDG